jgi:hypothetical protein
MDGSGPPEAVSMSISEFSRQQQQQQLKKKRKKKKITSVSKKVIARIQSVYVCNDNHLTSMESCTPSLIIKSSAHPSLQLATT